MNFLLKNLELELDDSELLIGEKLLDEGKLSRLFENERHLWIAEVDQFEVEIQISPSRVRACSCDCDIFQKEKMCGHVVAALLALRRKLTEKPAPKSRGAAKPATSFQKLTISSVLNSLEGEELIAFVRRYAQANRNFALALKTHFASKVYIPNIRDKYAQVLDSALLIFRKKDGRINSIAARQLLKVVEELLGQADDAFALEHYAESWAALAAILEKIIPILRKAEAESAGLRSAIESIFEKIRQLIAAPLPPDLQQEIWEFLSSEFFRPAYRINELVGLFPELLLALAKDAERTELLLESIELELAKPQLAEVLRQELLKIKILLLEKPALAAEAQAFTLDCLSQPEKMEQVLRTAEAKKLLPKIQPLIEKALRFAGDAELKARLEEALLLIAQQEGNPQVVVALSKKQLIETGDIQFFEKCKVHFKGDWPTFVQQLLAELIQEPGFSDNIRTIAGILAREKRLDDLMELLQNRQSLDLLMDYDAFLLKSHREQAFKLYDQLLKAYLSDHLGARAARYFHQVLNHLRQSGAPELAERLFQSIRKVFPRKSLTFREGDVEFVGL